MIKFFSLILNFILNKLVELFSSNKELWYRVDEVTYLARRFRRVRWSQGWYFVLTFVH